MTNETNVTKDNWSLFYETVSTLAGSQGFYSGLLNQILEFDDDTLAQAIDEINNLDTKFNDILDVIMFLEG